MVQVMARPKQCFIESGRLDEANWKNLPAGGSCGAGREGLGYGR